MVSIVMTTYNGEKYLVEQLNSIRDQTRKPDEVLIFDDCSKDNTAKLVMEYITINSLTNWYFTVNENNKGYSRNFSDAIKEAKGDIIFLADQDDIWHKDKIEKMCAIVEQNSQIELLASNVHPFYMGKNPQKVNFETFPQKFEIIRIHNRRKWIKPARPGCSMCFKRNLLRDYDQLWFSDYAHDSLLWGMAVLHGTAYLYNRSTLDFRRHDTNASSRGGFRMDYRLKGLKTEIEIVSRMHDFARDNQKNDEQFLKKQLLVYKKRKSLLESRNVVGMILMLPYIKYYGRSRYWMTDIYYCLK